MFCLPWRAPWRHVITEAQGVRIIVHYLQAHPERLYLPEHILVIEALRDAFPCPPASSRPQR